jgi:methionyl-tRNA formyltransferase
MRILIVTSEVTLVKDNYNQFLRHLFENYSNIYGLVVLTNNNKSMLVKGMGLAFMGAKKTGANLIKNSLNSKRRDHEAVANNYHIPTHYFKSVNDLEFYQFVKTNDIDLIVNARTRDIYKKKILKTPKLGCINIHHGILPNHRGLMCDLYALYENKSAGFSIHKMETKIDNGRILEIEHVTDASSKNKNNFPEHIYQSSIVEGQVMARLLKKIEKSKAIPDGIENLSTTITYTKNPDLKMIQKMIKKGMIL